MNNLPSTLFQHLANHSIQQLEPAWLKLEKHSDVIIDIGGTWQHYSHQTPKIGVHAIYPQTRHLSRKIRSLIDFLVNYFGDKPQWVI
ncbi:MAG: hypothetical protein L3J61_00945 [Ghiorsea sp.]|nr:hypothetical protein [Ghiorsea sp.]